MCVCVCVYICVCVYMCVCIYIYAFCMCIYTYIYIYIYISPGKDTGMGGHFLLQGIFSTQALSVPALADGFFTTSTT